MDVDLGDLNAFLAVARAKGFRDGARASGGSASGLSEAVRRLETQLGVRLLHRTTRSVVPTEPGQRLLDRLGPALNEVQAALDVVNSLLTSQNTGSPTTSETLMFPDQTNAGSTLGQHEERVHT
jgi:DNA-binding transcriptional LysR family regulator